MQAMSNKTCQQTSYIPPPKVADLMEVWDVKQGLGDYIEDIHHHTRPHHFRFKLVDGKAEMMYKYWSEDTKWLLDPDPPSEPIHILKDSYTPPSAIPVVPPNLTSLNLDQLMTDLSRLPEDYLPTEKKREWEVVVGNLRSSEVREYVTKPLPQFHVTRRQMLPASSTLTPASSATLPPSIKSLIDKDNQRPPVS